jgi:hypothetical protein
MYDDFWMIELQFVGPCVTKVDSPQVGTLTDPGKPVTLRTCPISGPHAIGWHRVRRHKKPVT